MALETPSERSLKNLLKWPNNLRMGRFLLIHLLCFAAIWTGVTLEAVLLCVALYVVRMFAVTAGYHRYFSHRTYKMGRVMQFLMAFLAQSSAQKGVLWWAAHHRHHHKYSDMPEDVHSVKQDGFWWSHVGWVFSDEWNDTDYERVKDLSKYPELRWLNRYDMVPPVVLAIGCYLWMGWTGVVVGFIWSTVILWHGTFSINSLAHVFGRRRYDTTDESRNSFLLAIITLGEGWHNNHHHYQASVNQGFFWWEVDLTYYALWAMSKVGLVSDLRRPPKHVVENKPHPAALLRAELNNSLKHAREDASRKVEEFKKGALHVQEEARLKVEEFKKSALHVQEEARLKVEELKLSAHQLQHDASRKVDEFSHAAMESMEEFRQAVNRAYEEAVRAAEELGEAGQQVLQPQNLPTK